MNKQKSKFLQNPWKEFIIRHQHLIKDIVDNESSVPACRKLLVNLARMELDYPRDKRTDVEVLDEIIGIYFNLRQGKKWKKNFG